MFHLIVYGSTDKFSHALKVITQKSADTLEQLDDYVVHYRELLSQGQLTALHLLMMDVRPEAGVLEVLLNEYGTIPIKERLIINPKPASTVTWNKAADAFTF